LLRESKIGGRYLKWIEKTPVPFLSRRSFDTLDGSLARRSGRNSKAGAFLDSVLDRYSDFFYLFGIWVYFLVHRGSQVVLLTAVLFFAFLGFFMVSYSRARGEGLGLSVSEGIFGRAERVLCLGMGCILNDLLIGFFPGSNWLGDHRVIISLLILLTLGTHWTALQRIRTLTKNL
jgi:CDP-diacylglycerol--glycerol-3-phosphate 3-phosphatidyltransferase